jgi:HD-GYP domain-containing protein (c-di-GMP phosphodiesterase class II)
MYRNHLLRASFTLDAALCGKVPCAIGCRSRNVLPWNLPFRLHTEALTAMQASETAILDEVPSPSPYDNISSPALAHWAQWCELSETLAPLLFTPLACEDFTHEISQCASTVIRLTRQDPDVAIFHMIHATPDKMHRYSILHAMHTAMLLALIGRRKDWGDARTASAVKAGLTMNLSITNLQIELAQHFGPLSTHQRQAIDAHPLASWKMLHDLGVTDEDWLIAVAQHHEQADGKGYPQGLTTIHQVADAIRTCDVFGAKISPRVGRAGMPTPRAAAEIFRQRSAGYFGATIIRELGLYPPGCLVELFTGEQAVVIKRTNDPNAPDVVLLSDDHGMDLNRLSASETSRLSGRYIIGAAPDQSWAERVPPEAILCAR